METTVEISTVQQGHCCCGRSRADIHHGMMDAFLLTSGYVTNRKTQNEV